MLNLTQMKVADVMSRSAVAIGQNARVPEIVRLLVKHGHSSLPVVDARGHVIGIVSEADLVRSPGNEMNASVDPTVLRYGAPKTRDKTADDVMKRDVVTVSEDTPLTELLRHFERRGLRRIPVTRHKMIVGAVDRQDLLRALVARSEDSANKNSPKNPHEDEFMHLFSANQTGMGAGPYSFGPATWLFRGSFG